MTIVRIIADDLTGALDTAAPLVGLAGPMPVLWDGAPRGADETSFALDTESREAPGPAASWLGAFRGADCAFKKIDSLLRGCTVDEIALCLERGLFASALIAPAFPAQQRITAGGRQYWRARPGDEWQLLDCDLLAELRRRVPIRHARSSEEVAGRGFFLCDASTDADLRALVNAGHRLPRPLLWIGAAGLARALAGPSQEITGALPGPLLVVIGSHHPVTLAQVEQLATQAPEAMAIVRLDSPDLAAPIGTLAGALPRWRRAALIFALPDGTGADVAGALFDRVMELAIRELPPPGTLVVTGGATLFRLVRGLGAQSLLVTGERMPGIACSRLAGGRWPGVAVISKSGAFGTPDLLVRWWHLAQPQEG